MKILIKPWALNFVFYKKLAFVLIIAVCLPSCKTSSDPSLAQVFRQMSLLSTGARTEFVGNNNGLHEGLKSNMTMGLASGRFLISARSGYSRHSASSAQISQAQEIGAKYQGGLFDGFNSKRYIALPLSGKCLLRGPFLIWDYRQDKLHSQSVYALNSDRIKAGNLMKIEGVQIYFPSHLWVASVNEASKKATSRLAACRTFKNDIHSLWRPFLLLGFRCRLEEASCCFCWGGLGLLGSSGGL